MECKTCKKEDMITIRAHSVDRNTVKLNGQTIQQGYAPGSDIGLDQESGNDDVIFTYCINCGQIQNDFPITLLWCWTTDHPNYECEECPKYDDCGYC